MDNVPWSSVASLPGSPPWAAMEHSTSFSSPWSPATERFSYWPQTETLWTSLRCRPAIGSAGAPSGSSTVDPWDVAERCCIFLSGRQIKPQRYPLTTQCTVDTADHSREVRCAKILFRTLCCLVMEERTMEWVTDSIDVIFHECILPLCRSIMVCHPISQPISLLDCRAGWRLAILIAVSAKNVILPWSLTSIRQAFFAGGITYPNHFSGYECWSDGLPSTKWNEWFQI